MTKNTSRCVIAFTFLMTVFSSIGAQGTSGNYPDMKQMQEYLKGTGMSDVQIQQMQGIMEDAAGQQAQHDAAILGKEEQEFEAAYGDNPIAQVEINQNSYVLRVIECKEMGSGTFRMTARQPPGKNDVKLGVSCCRTGISGGLGYIQAPEGLTDGIPSDGQFDGKSYRWEGKVAEFDGPDREPYVKIELSCEGLI